MRALSATARPPSGRAGRRSRTAGSEGERRPAGIERQELAASEGAAEKPQSHTEDGVRHDDEEHGPCAPGALETQQTERDAGRECCLNRSRRAEGDPVAEERDELAEGKCEKALEHPTRSLWQHGDTRDKEHRQEGEVPRGRHHAASRSSRASMRRRKASSRSSVPARARTSCGVASASRLPPAAGAGGRSNTGADREPRAEPQGPSAQLHAVTMTTSALEADPR